MTPCGNNCYTDFCSVARVANLKRVGILYHPRVETTQLKAGELQQFLEARGISVWLGSSWDTEKARTQIGGTDLILAVGGDGTILRVAQAVVPAAIPITGINMGKLGFMTELSAEEALSKLPDLLAGKGWLDERAMLQVAFGTGAGAKVHHALNDVVVARGAIPRVVYVEASIDDEILKNYRADGVIVATATGSTGYALAAGGPILYPQSQDFILVPIAPHLSASYALVLPPAAVIRLRLSTVHQATLSIDGQLNLPLADGDTITLKRSPHTTRFLRIHPANYFYQSLKERLMGSSK